MEHAGTIDQESEIPDEAGLLEKALNRAVSMNSGLARAHVQRFGGGRSGEELLTRLDRQFRIALAGSGAAVGATAIVPGFGTAAGAVLAGGQTLATLEATMLYVLSYAEATGIEIDDLERRRVLLMAVLLGKTGMQVVETVLGHGDDHGGGSVEGNREGGGKGDGDEKPGGLAAGGLSAGVVHTISRELRRRFLARFGIQQGLMGAARLLPFGAGAAVGAITGAASSRSVIKATRAAFGR